MIFGGVGFNFGRKLEFGTFGETKPVQISSVRNAPYRLISEPKIDYQFDQVINMATVYGEKSDSGMSSMSLREVYLEPHTQIKDFQFVFFEKVSITNVVMIISILQLLLIIMLNTRN